MIQSLQWSEKYQQIPLNLKKKHQIIQSVERNFGSLVKFLVYDRSDFPCCCVSASHLLHGLINEEIGIDTKVCEGSRLNVSINEICRFHSWLEYDDLIIDPTDFQFHVIDLWSLPLITENVIPKDIVLDNHLSEEELDRIYMDTYVKNATKRYQENPNPKEKYFLDLTQLLKTDQIHPIEYVNELKRCFGCKIFYSKSDPNYVYQPK